VNSFSSTSRLTDRDTEIVTAVRRHVQISSSQILRLYFADGSPASRGIRMRRSMARLAKWGEVQRLQRAIGGMFAGSSSTIYVPPGSRARSADAHKLDLTELYVRLIEAERASPGYQLVAFDPEPYSHVYIGNLIIKPDAHVHTETGGTGRLWFIEVDRGTEWRTQLAEKMRRFCQGYDRWPKRTFPRVLFIVPDEQRARLVREVAGRQKHPLFTVCLYEEAVDLLTSEE
jgi:hypothetical protein